MNFLKNQDSKDFADYVDTGTWSSKAIKEAKILNKQAKVVASSKDKNFSYIPNYQEIKFNQDAVYAYLTSNNTIEGTQWQAFPDTQKVPIIADMSSDIMSKRFDASKFGLIYAGAQKNIGPAGVCMVILHKSMIDLIPDGLPTMLNYKTYVSSNSLYNTPPCFSIYTVALVLKWLEESIGGLDKIEEINRKKAEILYSAIDNSAGFYKGTASHESRSFMNVTFRLPSEDLEKLFIKEADKNGFAGLKGHRSVGGCRASIYNALTIQAVQDLSGFMKNFVKTNG